MLEAKELAARTSGSDRDGGRTNAKGERDERQEAKRSLLYNKVRCMHRAARVERYGRTDGCVCDVRACLLCSLVWLCCVCVMAAWRVETQPPSRT